MHEKEAMKTKEFIEREGGSCLLIRGDVTLKSFCEDAVKQTLNHFNNRIDILVRFC